MTPSFIVFKLRPYSRVLVVAATMLSIQIAAIAQSSQSSAKPDRGLSPNGIYSVSDIENINLINGNMNLSIPLASLPPIAGGKLSLTLRANYNSKIWDVKRNEVTTNGTPPQTRYVKDIIQQSNIGGWSISGSYDIKFQQADLYDFGWLGPQSTDNDHNFFIGKPYPEWAKVQLITPDGATHELRPLDYMPYQGQRNFLWGYYWETPDRVVGTMRYYSSDGTFIWAKINPSGNNTKWDVYLPDGTHIIQKTNFQRIMDPNGNSIIIFKEDLGGGITVGHYQDEMATGATREIKYTQTLGSSTESIEYQTGEDSFATVSMLWGPKTVLGQTYNIQDHFNGTNEVCERTARFDAAMTMIREIELPQTQPAVQRKFTFSYNSDVTEQVTGLAWWTCDDPGNPTPITQSSKGWGSLSQMTTPSGAQVNYSYELNTVHFLLEATEAPRERISSKSVKQTDTNTTDTWTYFSSSPFGTVIGPDGSRITELAYTTDPAFASIYGGENGLGGLVYRTIRYLNNQPNVTVERHWRRLLFAGGSDLQPGTLHGSVFNAVVDAEYTTLHDANGVAVQMSAKTFQYDYNGNLTGESDYDWFSPTSIPGRDAQEVPTGLPTGLLPVRVIANNYHNPAPVGSDPGSGNVYAKRDKTTVTPLILNAPKEMTVGSSTATISKTRFHYDNNNDDGGFNTVPTIGNVTKVRQDKDGTWINSVHTHDSYGNVLTTTDPRGKTTTLVYDTTTNAQPISVTVDPNDLIPGDELTTTTEYDSYTGLVTKVTDPNGNEASTSYDNQLLSTPGNPVKDPYGRPGLGIGPSVTVTVGGTASSQRHKVITKYFDNTHKMEVLSDLNEEGDGKLRTQTTADQLGRTILTKSSEDGSAYTLVTDTIYEQAGRITYASNPHRSGNASSDGWTRATRDDLGRVVEVAAFDGATKPTATATNWNGRVQTNYNAEQTTVTDQAGKQRKSVVDGLGRLTKAFEDPGDPGQGKLNFETDYTYNALGNLLQVDQGSQHRFFTYDSLSRLKTAKNPEQVSGSTQIATTFEYDDASNLISKSGPNSGTSVSFTYDDLNRVKTKTLAKPSMSTVWDYTYDSGTVSNAKARLASVVLNGATDGYYYDAYDAMGRVTTSRQVTTSGSANIYTMSYGYNLAGEMTKQVYPSGKEYRTSFDNAGRVSEVSRYNSSMFDKTYASGFTYSAHGAVSSMTLGNSRIEKTTFNGRVQPTQITLGSSASPSSLLQLDYTYNTPSQANNNGNVRTQTITAPKTQSGTGNLVLTQNYSYDALNRLSFAEELIGAASQWNQTYDIDRWGNRAVNNTSTYIPSPVLTPQSLTTFDTATNRIKPAEMAGIAYDTSGNLTTQPNPGTGTDNMVYDAENHQTSYTKASAGTTNYSYDGDGHRVKKTDPSNNTTIFVYNAGGQLIAEYTSGTPSDGGTSYLTSDHLGSTRVVTKADANVKARYDYLPFGEEIDTNHGSRSLVTGYGASDETRQKFTQKERDNESGLDYFGARYYSSAQGRFTSVDVSMESGRPIRPQSWKRYAYVLNNPVRLIDPDGLQDRDPNKPRVVVIIFGGGNTLLSASGSKGSGTTRVVNMVAGGSTEGIGESSTSDFEAQNIAQKIKNDFPDAEVRLAGPDAQSQIFNDLSTNKPDNIIIEGYSSGAVSAVGLSNNLTNGGQRVDQLTTVDPPNTTFGIAPIRNPQLVGDAQNFTGFPHSNTIEGAKNTPVTDADRRDRTTQLNHQTIDDVTSPRVINRIEEKLKEVRKP